MKRTSIETGNKELFLHLFEKQMALHGQNDRNRIENCYNKSSTMRKFTIRKIDEKYPKDDIDEASVQSIDLKTKSNHWRIAAWTLKYFNE